MLAVLLISAFTICPAAAHVNQPEMAILQDVIANQIGYGDDYGKLATKQQKEIDFVLAHIDMNAHGSEYYDLLDEISKILGYGNDYHELTHGQRDNVTFYVKSTLLISDGKTLTKANQKRYDKLASQAEHNFISSHPKKDSWWSWMSWFIGVLATTVVVIIGLTIKGLFMKNSSATSTYVSDVLSGKI